ncbi:MAG: hypothetical protein ACRDUW_21755, partial [Pseudonocardiaceae bacterium]
TPIEWLLDGGVSLRRGRRSARFAVASKHASSTTAAGSCPGSARVIVATHSSVDERVRKRLFVA